MTDSTDWQDLIQKHLDGLTSEEEAAALSDQIVSNEAVRLDYLKAARLHGALGDETLELGEEPIPFPRVEPKKTTRINSLVWPRQLAAAIVAGIFVGLTGLGVVWAVNSPRIEARFVPVADSSFESMSGAVPIGFPTEFGRWSGDPAEVIVDADGNHQLRFLKTANVTGKPGGGAAACNVFQLIDLSSLQQQWDTENSEDQFTLELSANFRREVAPTDAELPKSRLTIHSTLPSRTRFDRQSLAQHHTRSGCPQQQSPEVGARRILHAFRLLPARLRSESRPDLGQREFGQWRRHPRRPGRLLRR